MTVVTRPSMTDDSGALTDGTVVDKDFIDDILDEIDDQCHSATNTTTKPKAITDEVVTARGSKGSLDARLDVSLNDDGTLKTQASLVSTADAAELPQTNLVLNSCFVVWAAGDATQATGWVVAGGGAAVARAGTGLADTTRKMGSFCSKLTYGAATLTYYQDILDTTAYTALDALDGESVGLGAWVYASAASQARLYVADGATTTYSTYHTGGSTWEWLSLTHDLSGSATYLRVGIAVESGAANPVYLSGVTALLSEIAPTKWRPEPTILSTVAWYLQGQVSTGTSKGVYVFPRMAFVKDTHLYAKTAPTGAALQVDVNQDGSSMYSTVPNIAAAANHGADAPDGTYTYRCFAGRRDTTTTDAVMTVDVDQVGSGTAGSDLYIMVRFVEWLDPFEAFLATLPSKAS